MYVSINSERISRIKHDEANDDFPWKAMEYCLDYAGITKEDYPRFAGKVIFYVVTFGVLAVGLSQLACNPEVKPPTPPVM